MVSECSINFEKDIIVSDVELVTPKSVPGVFTKLVQPARKIARRNPKMVNR